jgi:hypothetical protein
MKSLKTKLDYRMFLFTANYKFAGLQTQCVCNMISNATPEGMLSILKEYRINSGGSIESVCVRDDSKHESQHDCHQSLITILMLLFRR